ncbi:MAG: hypothetical protein AYK18_07105 [Theionarchaea archaeon DG-70]|nr:MAG: hypothetical protein AYK18_07105 [Theionarchaea archaeon DG-70]
MFTAKLEAKTWKEIINALSTVIDEVSIEVTQEGIQFTTMDPSHICMVDFSMKSEHFEEYSVTGENVTLGIDVDEMRKAINRSKPGDTLEIIADQASITLKFTQKDSESLRRLKLQQIDVAFTEKYKVPHIDTLGEVKLPAYVFEDALKDIHLFADVITFVSEPNIFIIQGEGDSGSAFSEIREWIAYEVKEPCKCTYNLSYLFDISKISIDEVTIKLGNDVPIHISFTLRNAKFLYILAPRVEKE